MADTRIAKGLRVEQWDDKFFTEYVQENRFKPYMGKDENSIIQVKEDLTKKKGDRLNFALVNRLQNDMILGSNVLEGNEERMDTRSHRLTVNKRRTGVRTSEMEEQKSAIDLREAGRSVLMTRVMEDTRDLVIDALGSINRIKYASASEAQKDAWLADNSDRVLFGALKSNNSSNDHSASLANIDNTADKLTPSALSLMKRMALEASPKIKPIEINGGKRFYVAFTGTRAFRDLKDNSTITQAQRETVIVMQNNKLWQGGDIHWDGIIIHEIDDITPLVGVGNGGIDVMPVYLCGAQAIGIGWARRWKSVTKEFDYGDKYGISTSAIYGVEKLEFGTGSDEDEEDPTDPKQHGVVTGYFAGVADS